jgi:hypothetical protein
VTGPTNTPRGEHAGTRGRRWEARLVSLGETVVEDDDEELAPPPRANRETRRAAWRMK